MKAVLALVAGTLFGAGLVVGGMTDPAKVVGFLDLAGAWDPSLAFVMGAALCVTLPTFQWLKGRSRPLLDERFYLPTRRDLDPQLIGGAVLFGVGWGLAGLCPGPALSGLLIGGWPIVLFVAAMLAGMFAHSAVLAPKGSDPVKASG